MFVYDFSFRSMTGAQIGRSVLQEAGIPSMLSRAPKQISDQGCGYVLEVSDFEGELAAQALRRRGVGFRRVFRRYDNGEMEELAYDLL